MVFSLRFFRVRCASRYRSEACLRVMLATVPPIAIAGAGYAPSACFSSFGCRPRLIWDKYCLAVARAARVNISLASPIETLVDEARLPPCLRSPWTVKVRLRFPMTTKKPFNSVSRASYQPSFGAGSWEIVLSVRGIRISAISEGPCPLKRFSNGVGGLSSWKVCV